MKTRSVFYGWSLFFLFIGFLKAAEIKEADLEFFETSVRPLLAKHCYKCHATDAKKIKGNFLIDSRWGWQKGGESGQVIIPGHAEKSQLINQIKHDPDFESMPPKYKLKKDEIATLIKWVNMGAPDPRKKKEPHKKENEFNLKELKKWWSWQKLTNPKVPDVKNTKWPSNSFDHFVLAKLEQKKWQPAEKADKRTLIRRLSFDLTGLPPKPSEVETFVKDTGKAAYAKLVDKYIASPHFGEHWSRKWLDLVRYAETKSFETDYTMPHVYKYRDYVTKVFNQDVPYNQFIMESLAGDILENPRVDPESKDNESIKGPGLFYFTNGQHGPPDMHADEARIFDSMIDVVSKSFLGLTIKCARCHDHKFDAITTADYYSLYGIIASSRFDYANANSPELIKNKMGLLKTQKKEIKKRLINKLKGQLGTLQKEIIALYENKADKTLKAKWEKIFQSVKSKDDLAYPFKVLVQAKDESAFKKEWNALVKGQNRKKKIQPESIDGLTKHSLGEWRTHGFGFTEKTRKNGEFVIVSDGDNILKSFVGGSAAAGVLSSRTGGSLKSPTFVLEGNKVWVRVKGRGARVHLMIQHYELVGSGPTTSRLTKSIKNDDWHWVSFNTNLWKGLRAYIDIQVNGDGNMHVSRRQHTYRHNDESYVAVNYATQNSKAWFEKETWGFKSQSKSQKNVTGDLVNQIGSIIDAWGSGSLAFAQQEILSRLMSIGILSHSIKGDNAFAELVKQYREIQKQIPIPNYVRTLADGKGEDEPVYIRGGHKNMSKEPNPRRFLDALDPSPFKGSGSGRLQWAKKVSDKNNPLTARVLVNRLWYHIFGRGLVFSVDNFGKMGRLPTHSELLDHLSQDFINHNWSMKTMIRKMVMSSTYQMSSKTTELVKNEDPENKLLQRMPIRRMHAEGIRDTILATSGRLDLKMYGPSVPVNLHETVSSRSRPGRSGPMDGNGRRSIYMELRRNFLPGLLTAFDMPNTSEPFGRRTVTNVPAQSLAMMNDPFVVGQAEFWAKRLLKENKEKSFSERVDNMHRRAFARPATQKEQQWAQDTFANLAELSGLDVKKDADHLQLWKDFCHVMFNRKELIYIF